ncbi:MAG: DNA translocase FtsK [Bacteroidales bacterium]
MAKQEKSKVLKEEKETIKAETAVPHRRDGIYLICGLISLAVAVFTFVSLVSYVFTWAEDQSLFSNKDMFNTLIDVENNGGKAGLYWANFLVTKLFGLGAFIVPFFFIGVALFCLKIKKIKVTRLFFVSLIGCILVSVAFSYIFSFTKFDAWFGSGAGGSYGYYVNNWLKNMVGVIGAGSIIFVTLIIWLIIINHNFITKFNNWINKITAPRPKKIKASPIEVVGDNATEDKADKVKETASNQKNNKNGEDETIFEINGDSVNGDTGEIIADNVDLPPFEVIGTNGKNIDEQNNLDELEIISAPQAPITSKDIPYFEKNEVREKENKPKDDEDFLEQYTEDELKTLFDPRLDLSSYQPPPLSLLEDYKDKWYEVSREELEKNNRQIVRTLGNYKIGVAKISARIGPTVTLYEIVPAPGVRVSQIKRLEEDIQLSLAAKGVRVVTLVGTNAIGIEVANEKPSTVSMLSVLDDTSFKEAKYDLPVALGKTITNEVLHFDLAKMPHLLVAGATGQGKSVGLNAVLASLLYRKHPSELKLVLVDPKKVELSLYSKIEKHFLAKLPDADEPVITDTQKVIFTLKSLCIEMDGRYDLLKLASVRNVKEYNEKFLQRKLNPLKGHRYMPYIVVIIDEFADLLMTAGREIEEPIARLAQLARAIGIHLVIATQRPTTSVITGNIKANFPARIAFMVRSSIDSRTILDQTGANQLIGRGDMLISTGGDLTRVQCAFIDTKEVERIVDFISKQRGYTTAHYLPEYTGEEKDGDSTPGVGEVDLNRRDGLFEDAAKLVVMHQQGSTSLIQRKMNLGYNRAGRIMDQLEMAGIVGPFEGSKARQVLIGDLSELDIKLSSIKDIYG